MDTIIPPIERRNKILYVLGLFCFIFIIVILLILFNLARVMPQKQVKTITEVKKKIVEMVTPTKKPLNKTEINFEVLNGSGVNGSAANAAKSLASQGFTNITIGNADSIIPNTQIYFSIDLLDYKEALLSDIKSIFPKATYTEDLTTPGQKIKIIIGEK